MTSFRRGFKDKLWDKFWHWQERCEHFPTTNCIIQKESPPKEALCERCLELTRRPA